MSDEYLGPKPTEEGSDEHYDESAYELYSGSDTPAEEPYEEHEPYPWETPAPAPTLNPVDRLLIDKTGEEAVNYTGDEESERDYRPIRQSHEYKSGCLGGVMYCVFILCLGVILACLGWMAASDMLALNKDDFSVTVSLDPSHFQSETVESYDEFGNPNGTERILRADIDYIATVL